MYKHFVLPTSKCRRFRKIAEAVSHTILRKLGERLGLVAALGALRGAADLRRAFRSPCRGPEGSVIPYIFPSATYSVPICFFLVFTIVRLGRVLIFEH